MVSRGIAKSGTRSRSSDPREHIDLNCGSRRLRERVVGREGQPRGSRKSSAALPRFCDAISPRPTDYLRSYLADHLAASPCACSGADVVLGEEVTLLAATAMRAACVERRRAGGRSIVVIHQEKCSARQTRRSAVSEYAASGVLSPSRYHAPSAAASTRTSATARLRPFAPVGGTMCAASPPGRAGRAASARRRAPHSGHALLDDRALTERPAVEVEPGVIPSRSARPATP